MKGFLKCCNTDILRNENFISFSYTDIEQFIDNLFRLSINCSIYLIFYQLRIRLLKKAELGLNSLISPVPLMTILPKAPYGVPVAILNKDFGWKHLPCSDMEYNTVYLIMTAMIKNFYQYILPKISKVFKNIPPTTRLKRFIFRFIFVAARLVYQNRVWKLKLYTDRPYERLAA